MTYTPEQLRVKADILETKGAILTGKEMAEDYRAHADALEKLKVAEDERDRLKAHWFRDDDPKETDYRDEYADWKGYDP